MAICVASSPGAVLEFRRLPTWSNMQRRPLRRAAGSRGNGTTGNGGKPSSTAHAKLRGGAVSKRGSQKGPSTRLRLQVREKQAASRDSREEKPPGGNGSLPTETPVAVAAATPTPPTIHTLPADDRDTSDGFMPSMIDPSDEVTPVPSPVPLEMPLPTGAGNKPDRQDASFNDGAGCTENISRDTENADVQQEVPGPSGMAASCLHDRETPVSTPSVQWSLNTAQLKCLENIRRVVEEANACGLYQQLHSLSGFATVSDGQLQVPQATAVAQNGPVTGATGALPLVARLHGGRGHGLGEIDSHGELAWTHERAMARLGLTEASLTNSIIIRQVLELSCTVCKAQRDGDSNPVLEYRALKCPAIASLVQVFGAHRPKNLSLRSSVNGSIFAVFLSAIANGRAATKMKVATILLESVDAETFDYKSLLSMTLEYLFDMSSTRRTASFSASTLPTPFTTSIAEATGMQLLEDGAGFTLDLMENHLVAALKSAPGATALLVTSAISTWRNTRNASTITQWTKSSKQLTAVDAFANEQPVMADPVASEGGRIQSEGRVPVNSTISWASRRMKCFHIWYGNLHREGGLPENPPVSCEVFWNILDGAFGTSYETPVELSVVAFVCGGIYGEFGDGRLSPPLGSKHTVCGSGNAAGGGCLARPTGKGKSAKKSELSLRFRPLLAAELTCFAAGTTSSASLLSMQRPESWMVQVGASHVDNPHKRIVLNDIGEEEWGRTMAAVAALGGSVFSPTLPTSSAAPQHSQPICFGPGANDGSYRDAPL